MSASGVYYGASVSKAQPARLDVVGGCPRLKIDDGTERNVVIASVSERIAGVPRRITLDDGGAFLAENAAEADALLLELGHVQGERIHRFESVGRRWAVVAVILIVAAAVSLRWVVPALAEAAIVLVPYPAEQRIGYRAYASATSLIFEESKISEERFRQVMNLADELLLVGEPEHRIQVVIHDSPKLGANALAFPGGPIVLTDALIELAPDDDALRGVIAHEIAHVERRHSMKRLLRMTGWAVIAGAVFGDASSLIEEVIAVPSILVDFAYSRAFEAEADARAVELMRLAGADPEAFARFLHLLTEKCGEYCDKTNWLSTHPGTADRVQALKLM